MTKEEYNLIKTSLESEVSIDVLSKVCQDILLNRIKWDEQPDRELRFLLEKIVGLIKFPIEVDLVTEKVAPTEGPIKLRDLAITGGITGIGILASFSKNKGISFIGGLMTGLGGYLLGQQLSKKDSDKTISRLVVTTTAQELGEQIDAIYTAFSAFYNYRQLEGRQKDILLWFQQLYRKSDNEELRESISELLDQYGYSFETFSEERSTDFELHGGRVEDTKTTIPAIINDKGTLICKGVAVIPQ